MFVRSIIGKKNFQLIGDLEIFCVCDIVTRMMIMKNSYKIALFFCISFIMSRYHRRFFRIISQLLLLCPEFSYSTFAPAEPMIATSISRVMPLAERAEIVPPRNLSRMSIRYNRKQGSNGPARVLRVGLQKSWPV